MQRLWELCNRTYLWSVRPFYWNCADVQLHWGAIQDVHWEVQGNLGFLGGMHQQYRWLCQVHQDHDWSEHDLGQLRDQCRANHGWPWSIYEQVQEHTFPYRLGKSTHRENVWRKLKNSCIELTAIRYHQSNPYVKRARKHVDEVKLIAICYMIKFYL